MQNFRFDFPREINCWYIIPPGRVLPERLSNGDVLLDGVAFSGLD